MLLSDAQDIYAAAQTPVSAPGLPPLQSYPRPAKHYRIEAFNIEAFVRAGLPKSQRYWALCT